MIIDCHNHADWLGHDLDKFVANMDEHGIDKTWLLTWEAPRTEYAEATYIKACPMGNAEGPIPFARNLSYRERCPERFVMGYAPDPRRPEAIDLFAGMVEMHGVRVYGELKLRMCYDNPDALRMFRFCGEVGAPVIVHIDYEFTGKLKYPRPNWWYGGGIEAFARAVKACPETDFLGHAPGFWSHISGDDQFDKVGYPKGPVEPGGRLPELLDECPNLYCDISAGSGCNALSRDPEFGKQFIERFQDRILYGRDNFDNQHQEFLNGLGLSQDILDKVYFKNALRLVPLEG